MNNGLIIRGLTFRESDTFVWKLVKDTQCNGAFPAASDIFVGNPCYDMPNLSNTQRFKVLKSGQISFNTGAGVLSAFAGMELPLEVYWKAPPGEFVEYSGSTGAIAEIRSNNYFLVYASYNGQSNFEGSTRVRYTDC